MKNIILLSLFLLSFMTPVMQAETIQISGAYLDKKNNPIASANVDYYLYGNLLAASTLTGANGYFSLQITYTGMNPGIAGGNEFSLSQNKPNPFSADTWFDAAIPEAGSLSIYSMAGVEIAHIDLLHGGAYQLKWGGLDQNGHKAPTGVYLYTLTSLGRMISNKMTVMQGDETGSPLEILSYANGQNILKNSWNSLTNDILRFTKNNTTQLELAFPTPASDTVLGNVTGNVGPNTTGILVAEVNMHNLPQWNLNDYFYNDDQNAYEVDDTVNFIVVSDTLLVFSGAIPGQYAPQITAIDPFENSLTASMTAEITVSNELEINITGTYLDKLSNPIAEADVYYYQQGSILLGQTTTTSGGTFSFTITTNGTTQDTMKFQKPNTSLKQIGIVTPEADTTLGMIIGNRGPINTGTIDETHFTIEDTVRWNLNNFFYNDDQSIYSVTGNHFEVSDTNLIFTRLVSGNNLATVTATDPQDTTLTAEMNATVTVVETIVIPDFAIAEDTATGVLIPNLNVYKNPGYTGTLTYSVISQSNPTLLSVSIDENALVLNFLQPDGNGTSLIGIRLVDGVLADTAWFNIQVQPRCDLSGIVTDIFTNAEMFGANLQFTFPTGVVNVITDTAGYYKIQAPLVTSTTWFPLKVTKSSYTPFRTWATITSNNDTVENFKIIPISTSSWSWELYNKAFRYFTDFSLNWPYGNTTVWWPAPPIEDAFSDNSLVGGQNITDNFNNLLINLQTILPTFNPVQSWPSNIVQQSSFAGYTLLPGHLAIYWDNSAVGAGDIGCTTNVSAHEHCEVRFKSYVGCNSGCSVPGANNAVFNQELGSAFGAYREPPQNPNYLSVFTDPACCNTYTSYDYSCATVYLNRSKVHYQNLNYALTDPEGYDWEIRPDSVLLSFPGGKTNSEPEGRTFRVKRVLENGKMESEVYEYGKVPSTVMKQFRFSFTKEEIEQREREEANYYRK